MSTNWIEVELAPARQDEIISVVGSLPRDPAAESWADMPSLSDLVEEHGVWQIVLATAFEAAHRLTPHDPSRALRSWRLTAEHALADSTIRLPEGIRRVGMLALAADSLADDEVLALASRVEPSSLPTFGPTLALLASLPVASGCLALRAARVPMTAVDALIRAIPSPWQQGAVLLASGRLVDRRDDQRGARTIHERLVADICCAVQSACESNPSQTDLESLAWRLGAVLDSVNARVYHDVVMNNTLWLERLARREAPKFDPAALVEGAFGRLLNYFLSEQRHGRRSHQCLSSDRWRGWLRRDMRTAAAQCGARAQCEVETSAFGAEHVLEHSAELVDPAGMAPQEDSLAELFSALTGRGMSADDALVQTLSCRRLPPWRRQLLAAIVSAFPRVKFEYCRAAVTVTDTVLPVDIDEARRDSRLHLALLLQVRAEVGVSFARHVASLDTEQARCAILHNQHHSLTEALRVASIYRHRLSATDYPKFVSFIATAFNMTQALALHSIDGRRGSEYRKRWEATLETTFPTKTGRPSSKSRPHAV